MIGVWLETLAIEWSGHDFDMSSRRCLAGRLTVDRTSWKCVEHLTTSEGHVRIQYLSPKAYFVVDISGADTSVKHKGVVDRDTYRIALGSRRVVWRS